MRGSDFFTRQRAIEDRRIARPYDAAAGGGQRQDVSGTLKLIGTPAGNAYSTAQDMIRYGRALLGHHLLDRELTETVMIGKVDKQTPTAPWHERDSYAYGLVDGEVGGRGWSGTTAGRRGSAPTSTCSPRRAGRPCSSATTDRRR
jgi:CubicO group peptidase (beta-lactamase class C family)